MVNVKLTFPYPDFLVLRQTPGYSAQWNNYKFFINEDIQDCDFWVTFGFVPKVEAANCPGNHLILITGEPFSIETYLEDYLKQFSLILTCQKEVRHPNAVYFQGLPWAVEKSYDELLNIKEVPKSKLISIVVSNKRFTAGHKKRYSFAMALKKYFGDTLDLYGRGINDFKDKWDVLAPYKYSIAIENCQCNDYLTEKLVDCYLAYTFPFYYGCPNISQYFSSDSHSLIDINDLDKSKKIIEDVLNNQSHYQQSIEALTKARLQCLNQYNLIPLIVNLIETRIIPSDDQNKKTITIYPEQFFKKPKISVLIPAGIWEKIFKKDLNKK